MPGLTSLPVVRVIDPAPSIYHTLRRRRHEGEVSSFEAVFAVLGGWVVLGELLSLRGAAGCALMLGGMLFDGP